MKLKRCLLLARKTMTNINSILKSRDITLLTNICIDKATVFSVEKCESWTTKKAGGGGLVTKSCWWTLATPGTIACQAPLSMGFSRQQYWSGLPFPSPRDLPDPGIEPVSLLCPALAGEFFTTSAPWEAQRCCRLQVKRSHTLQQRPYMLQPRPSTAK